MRAAIDEIDSWEHGRGELTLAAVAKRVGIAAPSMYKHIASLDELRRAVAVECVRELAETTTAAVMGRSGDDAVRALASSIRRFAREHPGRYLATQRAAKHDDPADAQLTAESDRLLRVISAALAGYDLDADATIDAIRVLRSAVHGFVLLEIDGGFGLPHSVAASFDTLARLLADSIRSLGATPSPSNPGSPS